MNQTFDITNHHLYIGGCDTVELAKEYGTPLYVMDEGYIRKIGGEYLAALREEGVTGKVLFASKAFSAVGMYKLAADIGLGLDVVSSGELYTAVQADFPREKIVMHGNNKTEEDIAFAVREKIGCIVLDNPAEVDMVEQAAAKAGVIMNVSLRIKPGVEAHTHEYIKTGTMDSKFGLGISDGTAMPVIGDILTKPHLHFRGFHCHIGSQIFELDAFLLAVDILTDFAVEVLNQTGYTIEEINFGGGFGITYTPDDQPLPPKAYLQATIQRLKKQCAKTGFPLPEVAIEPGRSIVGESGITLYTVGMIKDIPGIRKYISVDGGMTDNPRYALYQARYDATVANKADMPKGDRVTVAGRCCESGDRLIDDIDLQNPQTGDILAVFSTGAYNYSMASNYNRLPTPAVVLVKDGKSALLVKRQTLEDLTRNDVVPEWLNH